MVRTLLRTCLLLLLGCLLTLPALAGAGAGEREGIVKGQLIELHRDVPGDEPIPGFGLKQGRKTRALTAVQPQELVGQNVAVEDTSNLAGLQGEAEPESGTRELVASGLGARKTAVVLVNFANNGSTPVSSQTMMSRVFTGANSVNQFYQEQSGGTTSLGGIASPDGDVFGWWTLPMNQTTACSDASMRSLRTQAITYASGQGVNLYAYDHVVLYFPPNSACGWAGLGELPGNWSWINGYNATSVIAHEIGHNMGAHHAASLGCGANTITASGAGCTYTEYGDGFDVMGSSSALMSSWHRAKLGQQPTDARVTAAVDGNYTIDAANDSSADDPRLLLVPRQVGSSLMTQYFAVELRSTFGTFDTFASSSFQVSGVTIRLVPDFSQVEQSQLLDTHPGTGAGFSDSALQPGETFVDPLSGVRITNQATVGGTATLSVVVGASDTTAPSAPTLSVAGGPSGPLLTWTAASDNVGVARYEVRRDGVLIATTPSSTREYADRTALGFARASYQVAAVDGSANSAASNTVQIDLPDVTPPVMAAISGERLSNGDVALAYSAIDDRGVDHYEVSWTGGSTTTNVGQLLHLGAEKGPISYVIRAYDAAGNVSAPMTAAVGSAPGAAPAETPPSAPATPVPTPPAPLKRLLAPVLDDPPSLLIKRSRNGRLILSIKGASRISVKSGSWRASAKGSRFARTMPARVRKARKARMTVRATVRGVSMHATLVVRRGVVKTS
jgi:hypothetical protein